MRLTLVCDRCFKKTRVGRESAVVTCAGCAADHALRWNDALTDDGRLQRCAVCTQSSFYVEADFPAGLGCLVVIGCIVAFLATENLWILIGSGVANAALWLTLPRRTICYKCLSEYRGVKRDSAHKEYELAQGARFADHPKRKQ